VPVLSSAATLGAAQIARAASLPLRARVSPGRAAALESWRQRNAVLDTLFYDVSVVSQIEAVDLSPWLAAEGAILIVPPSGSSRLTLCTSVPEFIAKADGVRALAIAGVGSSALGSAAFARNIADAIGGPVAAVVSGYGLADLVTEALGGYFLFGALNSMRHAFEGLDRLTEWRPPISSAGIESPGDFIRQSRDTDTVLALLSDKRLSFDLLVGHSKGNLVLAEALYELVGTDLDTARSLAASACIVTVSARIAMPPLFSRVIDIMGAWDWFGALNSRPDIPADYLVANAWHHTNTELPAHLPVTKTLRRVLA
jgi:hypothetical protein